MENPPPICATCLRVMGDDDPWVVYDGGLLVHEGDCEAGARRRGKEPTAWRSSTMRRKGNSGDAPKLSPREQHLLKLAKFKPALAPTRPVEVVHRPGAQWRWVCARCGRYVVGEPATKNRNRWYCGCDADNSRPWRDTESADAIVQATADYFNVEETAVRGPKRAPSLVYARHLAMYLCREFTEMSLPAIAAVFGGRDHTSVLHALRKIERLAGVDPTRKQIADLTALLRPQQNPQEASP